MRISFETYNSFRRARRVREELGHGFVFAVHGNKPCHSFDIFDKRQQAAWRKEHGNVILDFGAGHLTETNILNSAGFDCTPFEPYHIGLSEIDKESSLAISREFLKAVSDDKEFTSVFISSVLFPKHGKDGTGYFGIESNPKTRMMYVKYGIDAQSAENLQKSVNIS